jgi:hypothetical protein
MATTEKSMRQQIAAMRARWPAFDLAGLTGGRATWFGLLVGMARPYRVMIEYGPPTRDQSLPLLARIPLVRVLSPRLEPQWNAAEEAPLPHVFFDPSDLTLSPLCLFDPDKNEWSPADLISRTTLPWTVDWLVCYEGWLATGLWHGGGRHALTQAKAQS